jgi:uncharacterized membrane protein YgdD (TMEM256/DUF423 family)
MKWKFYTQTALFICGFGILAGAFGAHGLKKVLPENDLAVFETAVKYLLFQGMGLLILSINHRHFNYRLSTALLLMLIGIVLFSGSLFILSCSSLLSNLYLNWLGMITPIGGVLMITGFMYSAFFCLSKLEESTTESQTKQKKSHRKSV